MRSVKKTGVTLLSTEIFDWQIQSKKSTFSTGFLSQEIQSKKVETKKPFFDCARKTDWGFSRKRSFSTDKSDCVRNGLMCQNHGLEFGL